MDRRDILKVAVLAAGGTAVSAPAAAATARKSALSLGATGDAKRYAGALQRIAAYADVHRREYGLPGLTLVVVAPGGYSAQVRSGFSHVERQEALRPDHLFQIGSISKSFVSLCIHQLAQEGRLSLSDDIRKVLPEVALPPEPPITLVNLMDHSSGLPDSAPLFPRTPDGKLWSAFKPGSAWSYSNTAYQLLGKVIERLDGRPLAQSLERRIFAPLGMTGARGAIFASDRGRYAASYTAFDAGVDSHIHGRLGPAAWINTTTGAGCIAATTGDMAHWLRYLVSAGCGKGAPLLSDDGARNFTNATAAAPNWPVGNGTARYGAGLAHVPVEGRTIMHHTGGMVSFSSSMHVDPVAGVGCFASTNCGQQDYRPRDLTAYACAVLRNVIEPHAGLLPKPAPIKPAPKPAPIAKAGPVRADLAALAGRYENDSPWFGALQIEAHSDGLYLDLEGNSIPLEANPDGYWTLKVPASTERFRFEGLVNGRPQVLNFSGNDFERRDT
ncbi:serine hydrolase [Novosphingobium sp.]|uniref:serine hydrolase n=1 Tax=Novosphingobium sp. TaxID=1874826 RepID=UPI0038B8C2D4